MIIDSYNEFSDAQAETTVAAHDSTNTVDLNSDGDAEVIRLRFHARVETTCTSGGSATVLVKLQTSSDNSSWVDVWASAAIPVASLVAGYKFTPPGGVLLYGGIKRYLKVTYTIGTAVLTAGKFDAFLSHDADTNEF